MIKKVFTVFLAIVLLSFSTAEEKKLKFEFTIEEVNIIYTALGELPAKTTEAIRAKIAYEANKQIADTTKKK